MSMRELLVGAGADQRASNDKRYLYYVESGKFVALYDTELICHSFGAGGSGGVSAGNRSCVSGGGAGGYAKKRIKLVKGQVLVITVGAPGIYKSPNYGQLLAGADGGTTSVTGPGIDMVTGGGKGGGANLIKDSADFTGIYGGAGGTATGGDENYNGGRGGNVYKVVRSFNFAATGGGAVNIGLGSFNGGDIRDTDGATGGAGVGSDGRNLSYGSTTLNASSGGGVGILSPFKSLSLSSKPLFGFLSSFGPATDGRVLISDGYSQSGEIDFGGSGGGAGTGGIYGQWISSLKLRSSGVFAGMGGVVWHSYSVSQEAAGFGGGGGGLFTTGSLYATSGGAGLVILEILL